MTKLGLKDLHPAVAEVLTARVWSVHSSREARPEDAGARRVLGRRLKGIGWRILAAVPIGGMVAVGLVALSGAQGPPLPVAAFLGAYLSGLGVGVGSVLMSKFGSSTSVTAEELRALVTGVEFNKPMAVYMETVCALMEAGDNVSEATGKEILATVNELLTQALSLDSRLERLRNAASTRSASELEEERDQLASKVAQTQDERARTDLSQSLAICEERLRNARELDPLIERLDAQREVVVQTLLSVQASVSRLQIAPSALTAPDVADVRRVIGEVATQTKAVEDAVEQVMALRS